MSIQNFHAARGSINVANISCTIFAGTVPVPYTYEAHSEANPIRTYFAQPQLWFTATERTDTSWLARLFTHPTNAGCKQASAPAGVVPTPMTPHDPMATAAQLSAISLAVAWNFAGSPLMFGTLRNRLHCICSTSYACPTHVLHVVRPHFNPLHFTPDIDAILTHRSVVGGNVSGSGQPTSWRR
jgi:hypothetical protein